MDFSDEEMALFSSLFSSSNQQAISSSHNLTLHTDVPPTIAALLTNANLTLLAEVAHYQLWFPLELSIDEFANIHPKLNAPEVIDTHGVKRSWRDSNGHFKTQQFEITSLSSTGLFLTPTSSDIKLNHRTKLKFYLPDKHKVTLEVEKVRSSEIGIAAKITHIFTGAEQLRAYLFSVHKSQHARLYENIQV